MDDYSRYVTAVNKIFDYIEKMRAGWNNLDNKNYIDSIEDYKSIVTSKADLIKKPPTVATEEGEKTSEPAQDTEIKIDIGGETDTSIDIDNSDEEPADDGGNSLADLANEVVSAEEEKEEEVEEPRPITSFAPTRNPVGGTSSGIRGLEELANLGNIDILSEAPPIKQIEKNPLSGNH